MTKGCVELEGDEQVADARAFLAAPIEDGLVSIAEREMRLTPKGRPFLRNACMTLDARLRAKTPDTKVFSSAL